MILKQKVSFEKICYLAVLPLMEQNVKQILEYCRHYQQGLNNRF